MANLKAAHNVTYDLFRSLGLTALSGNPGLHRGDVFPELSRLTPLSEERI